MELLTQIKMATDSDDEGKSDVLSGEELLTQTQQMATDSDDEEKSDVVSGDELLTQTQQIVNDDDAASNGTEGKALSDNDNSLNIKKVSDKKRKNWFYLEQISMQHREKRKFYPPEIVKIIN